MSDLLKPKPADDRPIYAPPRVTRLSDLHFGKGVCEPGSGDDSCTTTGNNATVVCFPTGSGGAPPG